MFLGQGQSPSARSPARSPRCPFLPPSRGKAEWWKKPEPLFSQVKSGAVLACWLSHAYSIRPGPGPSGKEEGDSSPLFNIPLQAWLYLSCLPRRREGGGWSEVPVHLHFKLFQRRAAHFVPPRRRGCRVLLQVGRVPGHRDALRARRRPALPADPLPPQASEAEPGPGTLLCHQLEPPHPFHRFKGENSAQPRSSEKETPSPPSTS